MRFPSRILLGSLLILFGLVRPAPVLGQFPDFTRSNSFPNLVAPYMPRFVEMPRLSSTDRLHRMIQDGKLRLTVADAIALALENNLDIARRQSMEIQHPAKSIQQQLVSLTSLQSPRK